MSLRKDDIVRHKDGLMYLVTQVTKNGGMVYCYCLKNTDCHMLDFFGLRRARFLPTSLTKIGRFTKLNKQGMSNMESVRDTAKMATIANMVKGDLLDSLEHNARLIGEIHIITNLSYGQIISFELTVPHSLKEIYEGLRFGNKEIWEYLIRFKENFNIV